MIMPLSDAASSAVSPLGAARECAVEIRSMSKTFGGVHALRRVDLDIAVGEVHGLLGHNGSGKSTLIKILAGYHAPDPGGHLRLYGTPVHLPVSPGTARRLGLGFVHQDLGLVPTLSIAANYTITDMATQSRWRIRWSDEAQRTRTALRVHGIDVDPSRPISSLPPPQRAMLAIVRATEELKRWSAATHGTERAVLVLDEPTAFLPREGIDALFGLMGDFKRQGVSIILVSHKLDEVLEVTDRITILRDGEVVGTTDTRATTKGELVDMIVGRHVSNHRQRAAIDSHGSARDRPRVVVRDLHSRRVRGVSFRVGRGEIIGLTGLMGGGFMETLYCLFGAQPATGSMELDGQSLDLAHWKPAEAVKAGLGLVPADRGGAAVVASLTVGANVSLLTLNRHHRGPWLSQRSITRAARGLLHRYGVRPPDPDLPLQDLSGGNQQKVVVAKWMAGDPRFLLLDEPTQGVDVGAREEIYGLIRGAAANGAAVVVASTDHEQLADVCSRVLVFSGGQVMDEIQEPELSKEAIAEACLTSAPSLMPPESPL